MTAAVTRRLLAALWGALALLTALVAPSQARSAVTCTDTVICPPGIYFGVSLPGAPRDTAGLTTFGAHLGKQPTVANYFAAFGDQLDRAGLAGLAAAHRLPMVTWSPSVKGNVGNPYPLSSIAAGAYDTYLTAQGRALATVPGRVVVRFAHEMNASWFPWGRGVNGNTDAHYVAAYRHVHDVVRAAGATNVVWVWSPAVVAGAKPLGTLYPGASYVDWVGPDLYFPHSTDTLASLWNPVRDDIDTFAGDKPLVFAETGVAPGPTRPTQIADLVGGLLHTPRLAGIVWFEESGTADWRVDGDPGARAALAAQLADPWFTQPGTTGTVALPPLYQSRPVVPAAPQIGTALTVTRAAWRAGDVVTGRWFRCGSPTDTASCAAVPGAVADTYLPQVADWHAYLRFAEHAVNAAGSADVWSPPGAPVQVTPDAPAAPAVTSISTGLHVVFPPAPSGTTHWLLTLDVKQLVPIPVTTTDYWLPTLTNGRSYSIGLRAADIAGASTLASRSTTVIAVPMAGPSTPYVVVTGATASFQLPTPPTGAQAWLLTLDGATVTLPITATSWTSPALATGTAHTWTLSPAAGAGSSGGWGSVGAASSNRFVTLGTPVAPSVVAIRSGVTFTFGPLPVGATGWQLTVGPTTYPVSTATTATVTGLAGGYRASWSLRAVTAGSRSDALSGSVVPA